MRLFVVPAPPYTPKRFAWLPST